MTIPDYIDQMIGAFARTVVGQFEDALLDYGDDEQVPRVVAALEKFRRHTPLQPHVEPVNLFGFAHTETCWASDPGTPTGVYFRLLPAARQLGMTEGAAHTWAQREWDGALSDQRKMDEERGQLGWECLRHVIDLDLCLIFDDETANPDAGGKRWSHASEWLVSVDRVMSLILSSPWSREFMNNSRSMMSWAMKQSGLEGQVGGAKTVEQRTGVDGAVEWVQTGRTLADAFAQDRAGISEEEARRQAFSGPAGALNPETPHP